MLFDRETGTCKKILNFKQLGFDDLQILGKYNYNKAEEKLPNHVHNGMIEICYYDKGSQYFEVNGKQFLVKGGDVFIHYPGEVHGSGGHPEERGCLYWILIKLDKSIPNNLVKLCNLIIARNRRHFRGSKDIKRVLEEIYTIAANPEDEDIKRIRIHLEIQQLLLCLLDRIDCQAKEAENERLNKVLQYIEAKLTENPSVSELAREMNLSESRFKNLFKELTGFTPGDYIQRKKIEIAQQKITADPGLNFTELAYELNFSSPQYFCTVFKKYTGESPGAIRVKHSLLSQLY
jgi:AraC-like DNA-binding protein